MSSKNRIHYFTNIEVYSEDNLEKREIYLESLCEQNGDTKRDNSFDKWSGDIEIQMVMVPVSIKTISR